MTPQQKSDPTSAHSPDQEPRRGVAPAVRRHRRGRAGGCVAVQGDFCEASMWLASVSAGPPPAVAAKVWKSWFTHRARPQQVLHEAEFTHMLPTVQTIRAQDRLPSLQGADGIWLAGGTSFCPMPRRRRSCPRCR